MDSKQTPVQSAPVSHRKKWPLIVLAVLVGIGLIAGGGYFIYKKKFAKKSTTDEAKVGQLNPINPTFDMLHGKTVRVSVKDGGVGSVYNSDKVGMLVTIPAGAVEKDIEIKIIPIEKQKEGLSGLTILPDNIKFKKPLVLSFDFSLSSIKNDKAPTNGMGNEIRISGSSHIYYYNPVSTSLMPQLVARSTETKVAITAEINGGGIYCYILDDKNEVARADYALKIKEQTVGVTLEAAKTLFANNKKIDDNSKDLLSNAITRVKADKTPDVLQLSAALAIEKAMNGQKNAFLIEKVKADVYSGYLETICKDPAVSVDQLMSAWKTAQLARDDAAANNCKTRVQNVVAERVNKILDQPDPTYVDLLKAHQDVILADLESKFGPALEKKRHDKAVREAKDLLKDPSVDPRILAIALQNLQLFVDDQPELEAALEQRMRAGLDTDVQRVLNDPNASKQDIQRALAKNDFNGGNEETKKKLEDKLKTAKDGTEPKVDTTASEQVNEEMPAFDWGMIGAAFLQMMGVEDFTPEGLNKWANQQAQQFEELRAYTSEMCAFIESMGTPMDCDSKDAQLEEAISQFKNGVADQAEKIGEIQALPEEQVDNDYDGNNDETLSGSCITKEEAHEIDPDGTLGYTICPDNGDTGTSDQTDTEDQVQGTDNSEDATEEPAPATPEEEPTDTPPEE